MKNDYDIDDDDDARTECTLPMHSLYKTAVQCATLEDLIFMQGKHPKIRSMIISVYSFTLLGNLVDTCEVVDYKPFLSYVREDDDYYSLCRRLTEISGEADVEKFRLAVVFDKVPYFIPKPSTAAAAVLHTTGDGSGTINNHHHQDISISSVWSHFVDKYPSFVAKKDSSIVGSNNNNLRVHGNFPITTGKSKFGNHTRIFPQLGIQRSVSDLHSKLRYKVQNVCMCSSTQCDDDDNDDNYDDHDDHDDIYDDDCSCFCCCFRYCYNCSFISIDRIKG